MDAHDKNDRDQADEPRVVTLGWPILVLPLVAFAVLAGAYFMGRNTDGGPVGGPAAQVTVLPNPTAEALVGGAVQVEPVTAYASDEVVQLPERYHPLTDTQAPDFEMHLVGSDQNVRLSDYAGKPVLVNFWSTWCPPCRLEMPWINSIYEKYKDQGFVVLGVDAGEKVAAETVNDMVTQYVEGQGLTFPILLDDRTYQLQQAWAVAGLPSSFLVNPKGTITFVHTGMFPNEATLEDLVKRVLPGGAWADQVPVGASSGS